MAVGEIPNLNDTLSGLRSETHRSVAAGIKKCKRVYIVDRNANSIFVNEMAVAIEILADWTTALSKPKIEKVSISLQRECEAIVTATFPARLGEAKLTIID